MKYLIPLLALLTGCGSDQISGIASTSTQSYRITPSPSPSPLSVPIATASPEPTIAPEACAIDNSGNQGWLTCTGPIQLLIESVSQVVVTRDMICFVIDGEGRPIIAQYACVTSLTASQWRGFVLTPSFDNPINLVKTWNSNPPFYNGAFPPEQSEMILRSLNVNDQGQLCIGIQDIVFGNIITTFCGYNILNDGSLQ